MWEEFWGWLRHREEPQLSLRPQDLAELETTAVQVAGEFAVSAPEVIVATATRLLHRQVPVRRLTGTEVAPGVAELSFADGTVAIVRSEHPGDLARLAIWLARSEVSTLGAGAAPGRVSLLGVDTAPGRVTLEVAHDGHRLRLITLGVRQPP